MMMFLLLLVLLRPNQPHEMDLNEGGQLSFTCLTQPKFPRSPRGAGVPGVPVGSEQTETNLRWEACCHLPLPASISQVTASCELGGSELVRTVTCQDLLAREWD